MDARTSAKPQDASFVRRIFLNAIVTELRDGAEDYRSLLDRHKLSYSPGTQLYETIPLRAYVRLFEEAAEHLGRPFLGCEMGQKFRPWDIGPLYALMASTPNLGSALAVFARFQSAWQSHTSLDMESVYGEEVITYNIHDSRVWPRIQDTEYAISSLCTVVRQLTNQSWNPVAVTFEHSVKERADQLKKFFRADIRGDAGANSLVLAQSDYALPVDDILRNNGAARAVFERHLSDLLQPPISIEATLAELVAHIVSRKLGHEPIVLDAIADEIRMSPRTMRRRLADSGMRFGKLVLQERMKKAENLIRTSDIQLGVVAMHCGYENYSAFSRAYRDWSGYSPMEARKGAPGD